LVVYQCWLCISVGCVSVSVVLVVFDFIFNVFLRKALQ